MSQLLGWLSEDDVVRVARLLQAFGLPVKAPEIDVDVALALMGHDKKVQAGRLRFVLLKKLGEGVVTADVPAEALHQVLSSALSQFVNKEA